MASGEFIFLFDEFKFSEGISRGRAAPSIDESFSNRLKSYKIFIFCWNFTAILTFRENGFGSTKIFYEENVSN